MEEHQFGTVRWSATRRERQHSVSRMPAFVDLTRENVVEVAGGRDSHAVAGSFARVAP
jgi:hypothetical protein